MIINEIILKNEKLSSQMKILSDEIARLEQLRDVFKKKPDQECGLNSNLSNVLTRKLNRAKQQFEMINNAYDETAHRRADLNTSAFLSETASEIKEIREVFNKIRYERTY